MITKRLGEYIEFKSITYRVFENSIGSSIGRIATAVRNNRSINTNLLEKIISVYKDLNSVWLLTGKGEMILTNDIPIEVQTTPVPLYDGKTLKSLSRLFNNSRISPVDYIWVPNLPICNGAIKITGQFMGTIIKSGDIIFYKKIEKILWGEMHLVSINIDGEEYITLKYIEEGLDQYSVLLTDQNSDYQKEIEISKIMALALVPARISINAML